MRSQKYARCPICCNRVYVDDCRAHLYFVHRKSPIREIREIAKTLDQWAKTDDQLVKGFRWAEQLKQIILRWRTTINGD